MTLILQASATSRSFKYCVSLLSSHNLVDHTSKGFLISVQLKLIIKELRV